jgi:hypothetical protein
MEQHPEKGGGGRGGRGGRSGRGGGDGDDGDDGRAEKRVRLEEDVVGQPTAPLGGGIQVETPEGNASEVSDKDSSHTGETGGNSEAAAEAGQTCSACDNTTGDDFSTCAKCAVVVCDECQVNDNAIDYCDRCNQNICPDCGVVEHCTECSTGICHACGELVDPVGCTACNGI